MKLKFFNGETMQKTFSGNIASMSLLEILNLLNSGKKTGRLAVTNNNMNGEIYLNEGIVLHSTCDSFNGVQAIWNIFSWTEGTFGFEMDVTAPTISITIPTEELLLQCKQIADEWEDIITIFPSQDLVLGLLSNASTKKITLNQEEWGILSRVNSKNTIREIIQLIDGNEVTAIKTLYQLANKGLIEIVKQKEPVIKQIVPELFYDQLKYELTNIIGPIAPVIINDAVKEVKEKITEFPFNKIPILIEKIANKIQEKNKRLIFTQKMLEQIKKL